DDDGFILCETRAICRYIAEKYADQGTPLLPTDLKAKALFEQAASFEAMNFHPHVAHFSFSNSRRGALTADACTSNEAQPEFMKDAVAALSEKLAVYDVILGKQKFLGGDELTLADLFHLYYAPVFAEKGVDVMTSSGPNVTRWWNELIHRPAWVKLKEADAAANK
ncbi:glutathione S-transferase, partial [Mycena rebaudengoi]